MPVDALGSRSNDDDESTDLVRGIAQAVSDGGACHDESVDVVDGPLVTQDPGGMGERILRTLA